MIIAFLRDNNTITCCDNAWQLMCIRSFNQSRSTGGEAWRQHTKRNIHDGSSCCVYCPKSTTVRKSFREKPCLTQKIPHFRRICQDLISHAQHGFSPERGVRTISTATRSGEGPPSPPVSLWCMHELLERKCTRSLNI